MASHDGRTASFHNASGSASLRVLLQDDGGHQRFQCQSEVLSTRCLLLPTDRIRARRCVALEGFEGCWGVGWADWAEGGFSAKRVQRMWTEDLDSRLTVDIDRGEEKAKRATFAYSLSSSKEGREEVVGFSAGLLSTVLSSRGKPKK